VVVLGASPKAHRYSHQAVLLLKARGFRITPVHPRADTVAEVAVVHSLEDVSRPVHTVTLYVSPAHLEEQLSALIALAPGRVIFNPGSESEVARQRFSAKGIPWIEDCTLVMLRSGAF
jgi:predicted CoA-binding protein